jgi:hypothetical protein
MNDDHIRDLTAVLTRAASEAGIPGEPALGWDGRAWRWIWIREKGHRFGELAMEVLPNASTLQATVSSIDDAELRLTAVVWDANRASQGWSRTYFSSPASFLAVYQSAGSDGMDPLAIALRAAWSEMEFHLIGSFSTDVSRDDLIGRLRHMIQGTEH